MEKADNVLNKTLANMTDSQNDVWVVCPKCKKEFNKMFKDGLCYECSMLQAPAPKYTFNNFAVSDKTEKILNRVKNFISTDKGIYLFGVSGVGKTHLAEALNYTVRQYSRYYNMPELMLSIRETFGNRTRTERDIIDECTDTRYLFLDDFGAEKASDFTIETVYLILDRAIRNGKPKMFITSNFNIEELANRMTDRISSRIVGLCDIIKLKGEDYRLKPRADVDG